MKSNVWLRLVWSDYQLQWDEADYGGIGVLRLPPDKVWKVKNQTNIKLPAF
jgi:nicotinic acetylcholine receptor, invertebrate